MSAPQPNDDGLDFEAALAELEALVERMETGELTLEESLAAFERGVKLTRQCQEVLRKAELRLKALTETPSGVELKELDPRSFQDDDDGER